MALKKSSNNLRRKLCTLILCQLKSHHRLWRWSNIELIVFAGYNPPISTTLSWGFYHHSLGYERVYLPHSEVADTHLQEDKIIILYLYLLPSVRGGWHSTATMSGQHHRCRSDITAALCDHPLTLGCTLWSHNLW